MDLTERRITKAGRPLDLRGRYFDALALLLQERGRLITKERFMAEVWRGVPVTDEALTQCIRTLRRELGDSAAHPRFIETVPRHGYRFIAPVEDMAGHAGIAEDAHHPPPMQPRAELAALAAGASGGGAAGALGGLLYGALAASQPEAGTGSLSVLLVVLAATIVLAALAGGAVGLGIGLARRFGGAGGGWTIAGAALGGLAIGAAVKFLGLDAFALLFGRTPGDITGAPEGALLGAGVGLGTWLSARRGASGLRRTALLGGATGALAGVAIALSGGVLMAGSLDLLAQSFPTSRIRLDQLGGMGSGSPALAIATILEAALFSACIALAFRLRGPSASAQEEGAAPPS